jgi:hypothetical protein
MSAAEHSNTSTHIKETTQSNSSPPTAVKSGKVAAKLPLFFQLLLQRFQDVVNTSKVLPPSNHGVFHYLQTEGPPSASPFQQLDAERLAAAKADFMKIEAEGIICRSNSFRVSPLHLVKKPDRSWRPCGNFVASITSPSRTLSSSKLDGFLCKDCRMQNFFKN